MHHPIASMKAAAGRPEPIIRRTNSQPRSSRQKTRHAFLVVSPAWRRRALTARPTIPPTEVIGSSQRSRVRRSALRGRVRTLFGFNWGKFCTKTLEPREVECRTQRSDQERRGLTESHAKFGAGQVEA
jgi:hypothetical protein